MAAKDKDDSERAKKIEEFYKDKKILVVDDSSASRASVAKTFNSMGANTSNIDTAGNFEQGMRAVERFKPEVLVCDFDLGEESGLKIIQAQREIFEDTSSLLSILVTGNSTQSAVAEAAEEDVDSYILKPFTAETLNDYITKATMIKIQPDPYRKLISEGRSLLQQHSNDAALKLFEEAKTKATNPALACSYIGQIHFEQQELDEAEDSYHKGLEFVPLHYRCLTGVLDVYLKEGKNESAYEIVKKIAGYFPISPQRLGTSLQLAVQTKHFEDIDYYYDIFTNLDYRDDFLVKTCSAALVVAGIYYLQREQVAPAIEIFRKASVTSARNPRILREIITSMVNHGHANETRDFMRKFPTESMKTADYLAMELLLADHLEDLNRTIELGRRLVKDGVKDPLIYRILVSRSMKAGFEDSAEKYAIEAGEEFPNQADSFKELLEEPDKLYD